MMQPGISNLQIFPNVTGNDEADTLLLWGWGWRGVTI